MIAPNDFSSSVVKPPFDYQVKDLLLEYLLGDVQIVFETANDSLNIPFDLLVLARRIKICSVPINSVVSPRIDRPPAATKSSVATPKAGLTDNPLVASLPPQLVAKVRADSSTGSLTIRAAAPTSLSNKGTTVAIVLLSRLLPGC